MAREFEQMQLTNLMALLPQGSPEYSTVLKAIITNYSGPSKDEILNDIEKAQAPNPQKQQMDQMQMQTAQATLQKLQAEIEEIGSRSAYTKSKIGTDQVKLQQHDDQLHITAAQTLVSQRKLDHANTHAHLGHAVSHNNNILSALVKIHGTVHKAKAAKAPAQ
jgi:uncharacterized membrane-anchored protein YhcB (DUF1043 family)